MIGAMGDRMTSGSAARVVTDVTSLPAAERIGAWTDSMYAHYYPLDVVAPGEEFRRGELRIMDIPGIRLGVLESDRFTVHRRPSHVACNGSDFYFVPVPLQRPLGTQQHGRDTMLQPGQATVINTSGAYAYLQHTPNNVATVRLDGDLVRNRVPFIDDIVALPFPRHSVLTGVLIDFILSVIRNAEGLDEPASGALSEQMLDLFGLALTVQADAGESGETSVRLAHLRRIMREIDTKLDRFDLGVDVIAGSLGLSRRYVQRLVGERGQTVSGLIRDRRIAAARRRLADPTLSGVSVASIGHSVGFADSARFSRVFRKLTDCSPGEYRRDLRNGSRSATIAAN